MEVHATIVEVQREKRERPGGAGGGEPRGRASQRVVAGSPAWHLPACSPVGCRTRRRGWWCLYFYSVLIFMADMGRNSCEQVDWLIDWLVGRLVGRSGWLCFLGSYRTVLCFLGNKLPGRYGMVVVWSEWMVFWKGGRFWEKTPGHASVVAVADKPILLPLYTDWPMCTSWLEG